MKKCYLDSNILVYYKDENSPFKEKAQAIISTLVPDEYELYISSLVLDEFIHSLLFILKQRGVQSSGKFRLLNEGLNSILQFAHMRIVNPPVSKESNMKVIEIMKDFNLGPRDAYHFLIMQENNIEYFATFDNDFKSVFKKNIFRKIMSS